MKFPSRIVIPCVVAYLLSGIAKETRGFHGFLKGLESSVLGALGNCSVDRSPTEDAMGKACSVHVVDFESTDVVRCVVLAVL